MASQHALNGRIGAAIRWSRTTAAERTRQTEAGRAGLLAKFEREADPDGRMSPADRAVAGERLRQAHMLRMAKRSAEARARRKAAS